MITPAGKINKSVGTRHASTDKFFGGSRNHFFKPALLPTVQTKLNVGSVNDPMEMEADQLAEQVVQTQQTNVQRKCSACEEEEKLRRKPAQPSIQTKTADATAVSDNVASKIESSKGKGGRLPSNTLQQMEKSFSTDFSNVRIHKDEDAAQLSSELNAQAFTTGSDIYFNSNKFSPSTQEGKRLLAHELTHVIQQSGNKTLVQRAPAPPAPTATTTTVTPASDADIREMVNSVIEQFNRSTEFFGIATINQQVLDRVLNSWSSMATTYTGFIETRLNNDATLLQSFKTAFNSAVRVLFTRAAATIPNTTVMQLYLSNLHRLPEWGRPDVSTFNLTNEAQRRAFVTELTNAFNLTNLFQGYTTIDHAALQSILTYLNRLVTDTQNILANQLSNDATLTDQLRTAYRSAIQQLLSRAAITTGESVTQMFLRYRYQTPPLIHEWADQQLAGITAAAPLGTSADIITGNVTFSNNGFDITIEPDGTQTGSGAETQAHMQYNTQLAHNWDGHNIITSFTAPVTPTITIRTNYGPGSSSSVRSGYGRGTTAEDVRLGNISLGYHERSHSRDYLKFIVNNAAPVFTGRVGMTRAAFTAAVSQYVTAMRNYSTQMSRTSELATDCVGSPNIVQYHAANGTHTTVTCP